MSSNLDSKFQNQATVLIAESIGSIPKNFYIEHQRLSAFKFYPPMSVDQLRSMALENVTKDEVKQQIVDRVYQILERRFQSMMIEWNSIAQNTAKRFVTNCLNEAIDDLRKKFIDTNGEIPSLVVQRLILNGDQLRIA